MQLADPHALDLEYTRTMMGFLLFKPDPRSIAMLGLGGGSLAKFCHRYLPRACIDVVEINPHVIALRDEFHVPPDGERLRVRCADAAHFVRDDPARFDVLLIDGFDSGGQPARLCSQRFYDDCHELLQPGGIVVVNLHLGHPRYDTLVDRIRRSFDDSVLVVDDGELTNSIVFACKGGALRAGRRALFSPRRLDRAAADSLRASFALVRAAANAANASGSGPPTPALVPAGATATVGCRGRTARAVDE
jgi:spermidine synthase